MGTIIIILLMMSCPLGLKAAPSSAVIDSHRPRRSGSPATEDANTNRMATRDSKFGPAGPGGLATATIPSRSNGSTGEQLFLEGACLAKSSCRQRSRELQGDKRACYCDQKCSHYDDCCHDAKWTSSFRQRIELGERELRQTRDQWHCHRINPIFGDVLLKASCRSDWLATNSLSEQQYQLARLVQRRCEFVRERGGLSELEVKQQLDPMGMMMPITDLGSGTTFANSYCLRCNRLAGDEAKSAEAAGRSPKLLYWSPMLECNYNLDSDDRNTLFDLISAKRGQALQYSRKRNKWVIAVAQEGRPDEAAGRDGERVCSITPTIPDSVEHMIRHCNSRSLHTCLAGPQLGRLNASELLEFERARLECQFGHQALTYGQTSDAVYFNPGCAKCNLERKLFCDLKMRKASQGVEKHLVHTLGPQNRTSDDRVLFPPPSLAGEPTGAPALDSEAGRSGKHGSVVSGSFSVLMDLYGSSQGDEQVGAVHQCQDPQNQVYDPFYLACRDVVCGLNSRLLGGRCVGSAELPSELTDCGPQADGPACQRADKHLSEVVDKFKPAMVYTTTVCLVVSIASLSTYLLLYWLSMFDLRRLVVDMAQHSAQLEQQQCNGNQFNKSSSPLDRFQRARNSNETNMSVSGSTAARCHSLSSRSVACLASSLLAAYLFFILGHRPVDRDQEAPEPASSSLSCFAVAAATYYCFLVAFNWMFLLSYDIWRTLRLATCQLRGPATHSQSKRFLSYMLFALLTAALVVGTSVLFDLAPIDCSPARNQTEEDLNYLLARQQSQCDHNHQPTGELARFVHNYRPKFGQRVGSCWFSNRRSLALFFGLPVTLIMLANLVFFIHSSYMVLQTSSRSSRHLSASGGSSPGSSVCKPSLLAASPRVGAPVSRVGSSASSTGSESSCATGSTSNGSSLTGYAHQSSLAAHSLTSVQTLQSQLSAGSQEEPQAEHQHQNQHLDQDQTRPGPPEGAHEQERALAAKLRKLEPSQSSSSLGNQSVGGASISASLAMKYDSFGSLMSRIVKDYRLYCRLSTIMGLTWLTGLMASLVDQSDLLWYLFVVLNTLQGLFIFIAFGCKRSKLANVRILLNYLDFRLRTSRPKTELSPEKKRKAEEPEGGDPSRTR